MSAVSDAFPVVQAFDDEVIRAGFRPGQMVLLAFLVMFGCVRGYAHLVRRGMGFGNLTIGTTRIHHLVPGIFLLLIRKSLPVFTFFLTRKPIPITTAK